MKSIIKELWHGNTSQLEQCTRDDKRPRNCIRLGVTLITELFLQPIGDDDN